MDIRRRVEISYEQVLSNEAQDPMNRDNNILLLARILKQIIEQQVVLLTRFGSLKSKSGVYSQIRNGSDEAIWEIDLNQAPDFFDRDKTINWFVEQVNQALENLAKIQSE